MKVITDISMEEQYTPKGTKKVLKVEDMELSQIMPWDYYIVQLMRAKCEPGRTSPHQDLIAECAKLADSILYERNKRFPLQIKVEGKISDGQIV